MKHIIKYFGVAVLGCVAFTSCNNEDYLDVTHYTMLTGNAMFENDENAVKGMTGCYDQMLPRTNDDPYKYWIFNGQHPTLDSQASGWDKDFMEQKWTADQAQLKTFWQQSYTAASRCNDFLAGIENAENVTDEVKTALKGEALALRGFEFFGLANTFGRVPLLITGETYSNTPVKARAKTFQEMWDFVIKDFKDASQLLDWKPFAGSFVDGVRQKTVPQYGRCTKGMALAFLGDAYMWKAYTCYSKDYGTNPNEDSLRICYQAAYDALKEILDNSDGNGSDVYQLAPSFTTLYDATESWPSEAIWQVVLNSGDDYGTWDNSKNAGARGWTGFYFAPTTNGAWGTYQMSWELYDSFENYNQPGDGDFYGSFDKRRDGSMVTATVPAQHWVDEHPRWQQNVRPTEKWIEANKKYLRGYKENVNGEWVYDQATYNAYDWEAEAGNGKYDPQHPIGYNPFNQEFVGWCGFHWASSDPAPTVWSTKHWRNGRGTDWSAMWIPDHIYFKRLANVYLDFAECCFRLGKAHEDEGWKYINKIRERAFGNLEVGKDLSKYIPYMQKVADYYSDQGHGDAVDVESYPLAFNTTTVKFPTAQDYYSQVKIDKKYPTDLDVWQIALGIERRKEFSAEPYLRSDLHKSGFLEVHVNTEYPKNDLPTSGASVIQQWKTARNFVFNLNKMFMPIPQDELDKNSACDQNEGY